METLVAVDADLSSSYSFGSSWLSPPSLSFFFNSVELERVINVTALDKKSSSNAAVCEIGSSDGWINVLFCGLE